MGHKTVQIKRHSYGTVKIRKAFETNILDPICPFCFEPLNEEEEDDA
jgi:hypothetical protein